MMMLAEVVELADAPDSKSGVGDNVWVQVPPSAPNLKVADNLGYQLLFFAWTLSDWLKIKAILHFEDTALIYIIL